LYYLYIIDSNRHPNNQSTRLQKSLLGYLIQLNTLVQHKKNYNEVLFDPNL